MKKYFFAMAAVFCFSSASFSQNQTQTVNWLKNNIGRIDHVNCPTIQLFGDYFDIDDNGLKLYNESESCSINWNEIKEIKDFIFVISNKEINNKPIVLKFYIEDQEDGLHFVSGFRHLANLNGKNLAKSH